MYYLPRADRMAADQNISPINAGIKSKPPILLPYICWKGSSMVTYPRERMGLAKNRPPIGMRTELWEPRISPRFYIFFSKWMFAVCNHEAQWVQLPYPKPSSSRNQTEPAPKPDRSLAGTRTPPYRWCILLRPKSLWDKDTINTSSSHHLEERYVVFHRGHRWPWSGRLHCVKWHMRGSMIVKPLILKL